MHAIRRPGFSRPNLLSTLNTCARMPGSIAVALHRVCAICAQPKPIGWCFSLPPRPLASLPMQHPIYALHPPPQLAKGADMMCR